MDELIKYIIAAIFGSIIAPLWTKFLGRKKNKLEEEKFRNDECLQTLELFKNSIVELKRQVDDLKSREKEAEKKIKDLEEHNARQDKYYSNKISELKDLNINQGKKIIELESKIKLLNEVKKQTKKSTSKKTNRSKAIIA